MSNMESFDDKLFTLMIQIIRTGNNMIPMQAIENFRPVVRNFGDLLVARMAFEAGKVADELQKNIDSGFGKVGEDIEALEKRLDALSEEVAALWTQGESEEAQEEGED